jgi:hypothetical protein
MPVKAPPAPMPPPFNFGGNIGAAWAENRGGPLVARH